MASREWDEPAVVGVLGRAGGVRLCQPANVVDDEEDARAAPGRSLVAEADEQGRAAVAHGCDDLLPEDAAQPRPCGADRVSNAVRAGKAGESSGSVSAGQRSSSATSSGKRASSRPIERTWRPNPEYL